MGFSVLIAAIGIGLAWKFYVISPEISERLATQFSGAHRTLLNKYYVDEFYGATAISGTFVSARAARDDERPALDLQWDNFSRSLETIGVPRIARSAWPRWPATAITLKPTAVFEQTPGPGTGERLS